MMNLRNLKTLNILNRNKTNNSRNFEKFNNNNFEIEELESIKKMDSRLKSWQLLSLFFKNELGFILTENRNGIAILVIFTSLYELSEHFQQRLTKLFTPFKPYSNLDATNSERKNQTFLFYYTFDWINYFFMLLNDFEDILDCSINTIQDPELPKYIVEFIVFVFKAIKLENDSFINSLDLSKLSESIVSMINDISFKEIIINFCKNIKNITIADIEREKRYNYGYRTYVLKKKKDRSK